MSTKKPTLEPFSEAHAAALLRISDRQVRRLVKAGVLPAKGPHGYDGPAVVAAWAEYLASDKETSADLAESKRLFWQSRARKERLETDQLAGELVELADVEQLFRECLSLIGIEMDALPGRLAGEVAGMSDAALIRRRLLDETRRIRSDAAAKLEALAAVRGNDRSAPAAA